jgi:hypothetical protein
MKTKNFKKYGFEKPDFDCKIFAETDLGLLGTVKSFNMDIAVIWDKMGKCFELGLKDGAVASPTYNLSFDFVEYIKPKKTKEITMYKWAAENENKNWVESMEFIKDGEKPKWINGNTKRLDYTKTIFEVDHE